MKRLAAILATFALSGCACLGDPAPASLYRYYELHETAPRAVSVPEPGSFGLLGLGAAGLYLRRRVR